MLKDKKIIIIGDRDGIPSLAIARLVEDSGMEVTYKAVHCSLCCHQGALDPEDQEAIKQLAETHGPENLVVVLGQTNPENIRVSVQTVTKGDPSGVGPLYGTKLGIETLHALEQDFRDQFADQQFDKHLGFYDKFSDRHGLEKSMREARAA